MQLLEERKLQLVEEAQQICQQRLKLLEQQQCDLAVNTTNVEEAVRKGEGVLAEQARPLAVGEQTPFLSRTYTYVLYIYMSTFFCNCEFVVVQEGRVVIQELQSVAEEFKKGKLKVATTAVVQVSGVEGECHCIFVFV